jgi:xanthine dehydrogenase accessory factor
MRHILDDLIAVLGMGQKAVTAAIVRSSGSAPRTSGARMLVREDGSLSGSVGGGALEGACLRKAAELMENGNDFAELNFELDAASAAGQGMVCGGAVTVLLHLVEPDALGWYRRLQSEYRKGLRPLLVTALPVAGTSPKLFHVGQEGGDEVVEELRCEILRKTGRAPFLMQFDDRQLFVEPLVHPGVVHLAGAGHVAFFTAQLASFAGFEVVVMDDREEFANRERYLMAKEVRVLESFTDCIKGLGRDDYVVIVTRGHLHDRDVLAQALRTQAGYIGMIGSRAKRASVYESLMREGFTEKDLVRVHNPIGLPIGADTPEEIAVSIVAQLIQVRAGIG